jgi:serine/threonine protein phosphatase 1
MEPPILWFCMTTYYIGDIHGQLRLLDLLLDRISPSSEDLLVFKGDYIDRGPDVPGVISRICELQDCGIPTKTELGNHEMIFFEYLGYQEPFLRLGPTYQRDRLRHSAIQRFVHRYMEPGVGGSATLHQYFGSGPQRVDLLPERHREFFEQLCLFSRENDVLSVHAGVTTNCECRTIDEVLAASDHVSDILWSRACARPTFDSSHWNFTLVVGHTAQSDGIARRWGNVILTDVNASVGLDLAAWSPERGVIYALKSGHWL